MELYGYAEKYSCLFIYDRAVFYISVRFIV